MNIKCSMCDGTGKYWLAPTEKCLTCNGTGIEDIPSPTQETNEFWIQAYGKSNISKAPGKWLLFVNKTEVDDVWKKIRQETIEEKLGCSSKVSTKRGWMHKGMPDDYVICVHTPDCKDKEDVLRVRNRLRELGFTSKIGYKTDEATFKGKDDLLYKE